MRSVGKKERKGASGKVEKDGRRPTGPFKVPRRQQRASNELIKLSNSFGLASERANKCSPLPRGPLETLSSTIGRAMSQIYARSSLRYLLSYDTEALVMFRKIVEKKRYRTSSRLVIN